VNCLYTTFTNMLDGHIRFQTIVLSTSEIGRWGVTLAMTLERSTLFMVLSVMYIICEGFKVDA
jgi:hypothetical protein